MKRRLCLVLGLAVALLVASMQPAYAVDVSGSPSKAKSVKANKVYTQKFEKEGDVDCFKFVSGGGKYKIKIWDPSGCVLLSSSAVSSSGQYSVGGSFELSPNYYYYWPEEDRSDIEAEPPEIISLGKVKKGTEFNITFTGNYKGSYKFKITGKAAASSKSQAKKAKAVNLTSSNTTISVKKSVKYNGKKREPSVTVKYKGKKLKKGTNYTVKYSNNVNVGTATVKITGKGSYKGTIKKTFKIKPKGKIYALVYGGTKGKDPSSSTNTQIMTRAFKNLKVPGYKVARVKKVNKGSFKKEQFDASVKSAFAKATKDDLCLVYLNTHGSKGKGVDISGGKSRGKKYGYESLLNTLGKHAKGKIILMTEVCYSGDFVDAAPKCNAKKRIAVLTATCSYMQAHQPASLLTPITAWLANYEDNRGAFTSALARGLGDKPHSDSGKKNPLAADMNGDKSVTLKELYGFINGDSVVIQTEQQPQFCAPKSMESLVLYKK